MRHPLCRASPDRRKAAGEMDGPDLELAAPVRKERDLFSIGRPLRLAILVGIVGELANPGPVRADEEDILLFSRRLERHPLSVRA